MGFLVSYGDMLFDCWVSQGVVSGGLGTAVMVDVLVALTLSYYLLKGRTKWHK